MNWEQVQSDLDSRFRKTPVEALKSNKWLSQKSITRSVHQTVCLAGVSNNYSSAYHVRAKPSEKQDRQRINVVWFDRRNYQPAVAFEVCRNAPEHSVEKLNQLPDEVEKFIVSKGESRPQIKRAVEANIPSNIHHVDAEFWR